MAGGEGWFRERADGLEIRMRLTPKAGRDGIDGPKAGADGRTWLAARVRAVPEDGKANAALIVLVAVSAGIARSRIAIVSGHAARLKVLHIACSRDDVAAILARLAAG